MKPIGKTPLLNRRDFIRVSFITGIGMVIAVALPGCNGKPSDKSTVKGEAESWFTPNVYIAIGDNEEVVITVYRQEMGQGVRTALTQILADELCAKWENIRVVQAPADGQYGDQLTGGSQSIQSQYAYLRKAGAVGRVLFVQAAAESWGVEAGTCYAAATMVYHKDSSKKESFGKLVPLAAKLEVPYSATVETKNPADFTLIGTDAKRVDGLDIVTGKAVYGLDVRVPGMRFAAVSRSPVFGGKVGSYDGAGALSVKGVQQVVEISNGIAVVADSTWAALQGRKGLQVTWEGGALELSTDALEQELLDKVKENAPDAAEDLTAYYTVSYLSHVPMEPMNCLANVGEDSFEVWAPTQNPQGALVKANQAAPVNGEKILHVPLIGGGFGRRLEMSLTGPSPVSVDYVREATEISKLVKAPVQVVWTREDDIHNDLFHPLSVTRVSAKRSDIKTLKTSYRQAAGPVPTGNFRAVNTIPEAFSHEIYVDEFAFANGLDPVELRKSYLNARAAAVVSLAAEKAGWGTALAAGRGRGIAYHATWGVTHVAQVAEVSVENGQVIVHRVVCAVDCGVVINPDMVKAQMESGIAFGLSCLLKNPITIQAGRVQQSNFNDYPILRIEEMPPVETYMVQSEESPTGIGEMANPVIAPAVVNALFAATGKRLRSMPIRYGELV
jgi:isoquinoline 1-oxidoreductase beta subunit